MPLHQWLSQQAPLNHLGLAAMEPKGGVVLVDTKLDDGSRQIQSPLKFKATVSQHALELVLLYCSPFSGTKLMMNQISLTFFLKVQCVSLVFLFDGVCSPGKSLCPISGFAGLRPEPQPRHQHWRGPIFYDHMCSHKDLVLARRSVFAIGNGPIPTH